VDNLPKIAADLLDLSPARTGRRRGLSKSSEFIVAGLTIDLPRISAA
jgi:hypothetical protein